MTDIPDYPALVELASRLEGKDKKTCELALYVLKRLDKKIAKRDARIAELEAENEQLLELLTKFMDANSDVLEVLRHGPEREAMSIFYIRIADMMNDILKFRAALEKKND